MAALSHFELTVLLLSLGIMLALARILGEVAQWGHQPAVVGELLAGLILGPSVLGMLAPEWNQALFPSVGSIAVVRDAFTSLAITLFLLVAGIEVDLSTVWRQGATALKVGIAGMVIPFLIGLGCGWLSPVSMGRSPDADSLVFALFFATALSITALPVIAKILMDLNLYRSDIGMVIVSAAVLNDIVGWMVFAVTLSLMDGGSAHGHPIGLTIAMVLIFAGIMLTIGRWTIHRCLPYIQAYSSGAGGVLSFALVLALIGGAFTEWIGVHAIFGAFLVGVAVGDSSHLRERTRITIDNFVSFIFAPLFFASIGLKVNFVANFNPQLVVTVLAIACFGKLLGCSVGAAWAGMSSRDRWATGFGMNARGAMEIILGLLALDTGLISEQLFVALVVMALATSMVSGPAMQWILGQSKRRTLASLIPSQRFVQRLRGTNRTEIIEELVRAACQSTNVDVDLAIRAVLDREETMHTGIGRGIAIPHGRLPELSGPLLAMGLSEAGVDFDSPDGASAHVIFLILAQENDGRIQLEMIAAIAQAFKPDWVMERILQARSYTELIAVLKSGVLAAPSH